MKEFENMIEVTKDYFYSVFNEDRYVWVKWTNRSELKAPPPYWQAHLDWVFDNQSERYVGYHLTSSWGAPDSFVVIEELANSEMIEYHKNLIREQEEERRIWDEKWIRDWKIKKRKQLLNKLSFGLLYKNFRKSHGPGLMEYIDDSNQIPYDPSSYNIDTVIKAMREAFNDIK